jgi:hypothetical protein
MSEDKQTDNVEKSTAVAGQNERLVMPLAWLVISDEDGIIYASGWREAANEHIQDAIEMELDGAARWRMVPVVEAKNV